MGCCDIHSTSPPPPPNPLEAWDPLCRLGRPASHGFWVPGPWLGKRMCFFFSSLFQAWKLTVGFWEDLSSLVMQYHQGFGKKTTEVDGVSVIAPRMPCF